MSYEARSLRPRHKESANSLPVGSRLVGKWRGQTYQVMNRIGQGANGTVYLASRGGEQIALKIAEDASALSLEHDNLLKLGIDSRGRQIGPQAFEIDDLQLGSDTYAALAMEYMDGINLVQFIEARGIEWVPVCLVKILRLLGGLHERGYVFGDLKPANIMLQPTSAEPRLIDFGGVTVQGQAVKEFTEMFDRAWWGLGTRKAEPGYDVAAAALLAAHLLGIVTKSDVERLAVQNPGIRSTWLLGQLQEQRNRFVIVPLLQQAVLGNYNDTQAFSREVVGVLNQNPIVTSIVQSSTVTPQSKRMKQQRPWDLTDWGLLIAILVFAITLAILIWL